MDELVKSNAVLADTNTELVATNNQLTNPIKNVCCEINSLRKQSSKAGDNPAKEKDGARELTRPCKW